ncbi:scopoletin glucosyltransferase-like [Chenopodium quinoa]|uniref:scopoletin glucosyltransferase-like n=1 Tax=Chenopodium quinoa TaxID=63459 RepID=UPI000B770247|nr:scopoletin glucosyltransferase-like [Chenopodium quinoa]
MSSMSSVEPQNLHVIFFPMIGHGHMIPMLDIAKLFSSHQVKTTIVTTPSNAPTFTKPLESYRNVGPKIDIEIIPFPSKETTCLPEGVENFEHATSPELVAKLWKATLLLQKPLRVVLEKYKPNCLIADKLFAFATEVAAEFNIPRLVFHGTGFFLLCALDAITKFEPHKSVLFDEEEFVIPHLPHEIKLTRLKLPQHIRENDNNNELVEFLKSAVESEERSYGVIVNSFYELEQDYADHYRKVMGRRAWHIGPVSLCNKENEAKFYRGKGSSIDEHECLRWLDSKRESSVVYVCFGTLSMFSTSQLREIAMGLEASGQEFIWVVKGSKDNEKEDEWLPKKGLIIRGWAPQVLILDHKSIGGFVTHCGWNSILEGVSCGIPMVTWPIFSEQFYNEKLVTEILRIGVGVGAKEWSRTVDDANVKSEEINEAITRVMVGDEALEMRSKAK